MVRNRDKNGNKSTTGASGKHGSNGGQVKSADRAGGNDMAGTAGANGHDNSASVQLNRRKRHSTGGTYATPSLMVTKGSFKKMSTDDKLVTLFDMMTGVTALADKMSKPESDIKAVKNVNDEQDERIKRLEYKAIDHEARNRRNNLVIRGIPEILKEENCEALFLSFIKENLGITDHVPVVQRAHRVPPGSNYRGKARPIVVFLRDYKDVELVLSQAYKLKGTNCGINRDFPPEIAQARSRLWGNYKQARADSPKGTVHIAYPAKLMVKGHVVQDEFPSWKYYTHTLRKEKAKIPEPKPDDVPISTRFDPLVANGH